MILPKAFKKRANKEKERTGGHCYCDQHLTIWRSAPDSTVVQRALTRQPLLNSPQDFKAINMMRILGQQQQTFHQVSM